MEGIYKPFGNVDKFSFAGQRFFSFIITIIRAAIAIHPIASKPTPGIGNGLAVFFGEGVGLARGEGEREREGVGVDTGISSADTISTAFSIPPPAVIKNSPFGIYIEFKVTG